MYVLWICAKGIWEKLCQHCYPGYSNNDVLQNFVTIAQINVLLHVCMESRFHQTYA